MIRNTPQLAEMRFSTFQRLKYLSIKFTGKFRLTDESFKSDLPTETLLKLHLDVDGLLPSSIETNALSYAYRPIHVFINHPISIGKQQCKLLTLEEEIYAPFLAVNPDNKIRVNSCPILCDCTIKWLFDAPKDWWMRVEAGDSNIGLQCDDQRSLYFYSDYDFRSCPKSNLLKYFGPENGSKLSNTPTLNSAAGSGSSSYSGDVAEVSSKDGSSSSASSSGSSSNTKPQSVEKVNDNELDTRENNLKREEKPEPVKVEPVVPVVPTELTAKTEPVEKDVLKTPPQPSQPVEGEKVTKVETVAPKVTVPKTPVPKASPVKPLESAVRSEAKKHSNPMRRL